MVLCLKTRESRSLPGLLNATTSSLNKKPNHHMLNKTIGHVPLYLFMQSKAKLLRSNQEPLKPKQFEATRFNDPKHIAKDQSGGQNPPSQGNAGWSSPVARQAHNLKAAGSNPAPATNMCTSL